MWVIWPQKWMFTFYAPVKCLLDAIVHWAIMLIFGLEYWSRLGKSSRKVLKKNTIASELTHAQNVSKVCNNWSNDTVRTIFRNEELFSTTKMGSSRRFGSLTFQAQDSFNYSWLFSDYFKKKSRAVTGIVPAPRSIPNFFVWLYLSCVFHPKIDIAGFLRGCELPLPDFFVDWLWVICGCWHGGSVPLTPLFRHHSNPLLALEQRPVAHCAKAYGARLFWGRGRHNLLDDLDLKP